MTDRENRPEATPEPATVSSELRYAFTGGQVLRQESGRQAEAQQFMLAQGWLQPMNTYYLAITDAGAAEHRRRDCRLPNVRRR
jgi:hypothetical protein